MRLHRFVAGVLFAIATAATAASALAAPPGYCSSGDGSRGYNQGYNLEYNLLRNSFTRYFTCGSLEAFIRSVRINLHGSSSDRFLQCRDLGINDAVDAAIKDVSENCTIPCAEHGGALGTAGAQQYCNIAGWRRSAGAMFLLSSEEPLPLCNLVAEQECRAAFQSFVNSNEQCRNFAAQDPYYQGQLDDACPLTSQ